MHKRSAYILITDLHASYRNKDSRHDYLGEVEKVIDEIFETVSKYVRSGHEVNLIFLGDITDNSFKDQSKAVYFNNIFVMLKRIVKNIYTVLGNHEMSYYKDNPFWTLMTKVDSERIHKVINRSWQALGALDLVSIVDTLEIGNTCIHFNHHATPISVPKPGMRNIGLFHKDIVAKAIIDDMRLNEGMDIFEAKPIYLEKSPGVLRGYDLCFFGHMHKIYGSWEFTDETTGKEISLRYLASLGRPNHSEVQDNFLTRNLPALIFDENENFLGVEDNLMQLPSRAESIKEDVIARKQEQYEEKKARKYFLDYKSFGDDPVKNIKEVLTQYGQVALSFFEDYLESDTPQFEHNLIESINDIRYL